MPSSMIHLLAAAEYLPSMPARFMIGNLAPDATKRGFKEKDLTHLRQFADERERLCELEKYARSMDLTDEFYVGVILHLYEDCLWDCSALKDFKEARGSNAEDWFVPYRTEISITSQWLYHNTSWSERVWTDMNAYTIAANCPPIMFTSSADIDEYIARNFIWHRDNIVNAPEIFTPDYIYAFVKSSVESFKSWSKRIFI
jgi:hypothetical protein